MAKVTRGKTSVSQYPCTSVSVILGQFKPRRVRSGGISSNPGVSIAEEVPSNLVPRMQVPDAHQKLRDRCSTILKVHERKSTKVGRLYASVVAQVSCSTSQGACFRCRDLGKAIAAFRLWHSRRFAMLTTTWSFVEAYTSRGAESGERGLTIRHI